MFLNPASLNPLYNPYAGSFSGFAQPSYPMTNGPIGLNVAMGFGTSFQGDFKPLGPMLQPQQPQDQGTGSKNKSFGNMNYNM
jgi:hypothetical protein